MNIVILTGRLTADPEHKLTANGREVTSFTIAVPRYKDTTDFIDCQAWGQTAVFIHRYFSKGKRISVQGELQADSWKDSDGKSRKVVRVNVSKAEFVGSKTDSETKASTNAFSGFEEIADDNGDLPFS